LTAKKRKIKFEENIKNNENLAINIETQNSINLLMESKAKEFAGNVF